MSIPVHSAEPSPLDGAKLNSVNEESIRALVHGFYDAVLKDEVIGPIFAREVAPERWPAHLDKMCAFWSSLLLKTRRYEGRPLRPHLQIPGLADKHFQQWLALFRQTAEQVFNGEDAAAVTALAAKIAHSFRLSIAFHRGDDTANLLPLTTGH